LQGPTRGNAISQVHDAVERLRGAGLAPANEAADQLLHIERQRRIVSPFHTLPTELIIKIIKLAANFTSHYGFMDGAGDYYEILHVLAQVCRFFAEIVKKTPELWSVLDVKYGEGDWETSLRLSQSHPLTIRYVSSSSIDPSSWSAVLPVISRWRIAHISLSPSAPLRLVSDLEKVGATQLQTLGLEYHKSPEESQPALDVLGGGAPNLRDLSLTAITLRDWSSPILHRLHSLSLSAIQDPGIPSLQLLSDALQGCPNLMTLKLYGVEFESITGDRAQIRLPHLRTVCFEYIDDEVDENLLSSIKAPHITDFRILKDPVEKVKIVYLSAITSFLASSFDACMASAARIRMEVGDTSVEVEMEAEGSADVVASFIIDHTFHGAKVLDWIVQRLDASLPISITLVVWNGIASVAMALASLTGVVEFATTVWDQDLRPLLDALGSPRTLPGGDHAWMWPKLESMKINSIMRPSVAKSVLRMLQKRYSVVVSGSQGEALQPPAVLKRLCLESTKSMSKGALRSICRAVGKNAFVSAQAHRLESDDTGNEDGGNEKAGTTPIENGGEDPLASNRIVDSD
ncbi:hypothetical protein FRB98_000228, partial [Tulasnella sp. 332]